MVFNLLRRNKKKDIERKVTTFSEQLAQAFAQIKTDISEVNNRLETNQKEMERISQWIDYLNRSNQRISESNSKLQQKYEKITENHSELHNSHKELDMGHSKTAKMAENLENKHQELSTAISTHKSELKSELNNQLQEHKELSGKELERLKSWVDYLSTHIDAQKRKEDDLKQDLSNMNKNWLEAYSKLRELLNALKSENNDLKSNLSGMQKELQSARDEVENTKNMAKNTILEVKSELSEKISKQIQTKIPPQPPVQQVQPAVQPVIQQVSPTASSFQRHIISRVMPNRKGYVIKFILDLVGENKYSTKEIEEIVVNEKQLCGRTSFYAYLKELKLKGRLSYAEIDDRSILVSTDTQQRLQE
jgi:chromosome segregation ATPase